MDNASKFIDQMENALAIGRGELTTGLFVSMLLAAILACRAKGETLEEAVRHANEVSAKVVMSDSSGKE